MGRKGMAIAAVLFIYVGGVALFMLASKAKAHQRAERIEKGWVEPAETFRAD